MKGIFLPFSVKWASGGLNLWEKYMVWVVIFTDTSIYVPSLTPCLSIIETSLQLSENITFYAVCGIQVASAKNPVAPLLVYPLVETLNFLWEGKKLIWMIRLIENFNFDKLYSKSMCRVVLKTFSIFKETAAVDLLLLESNVTWCVSHTHLNILLWRARKSNWLALSRPRPPTCLLGYFQEKKKSFSNSLRVVDMRLIGRGNFWVLTGFR